MVIEYLLHLGSERCVEWAKENLDSIQVLKVFNHIDKKLNLEVRNATALKSFVLLCHWLTCKIHSTICSPASRTFAF